LSSSVTSLDEVSQVFRFLGECVELGADPVVWRQHLADRCARLSRDTFVTLVESRVSILPGSGPRPETVAYANGGTLVNKRFDLIDRFMERPAEISPTVPAILTTGKAAATRLRCELVSDSDWYRSAFYQEYLRPLGLHDQVTTVDLAAPKTVSAICCLSYGREKCTVRSSQLLDLLHHEMTRLKFAGKLAPVGGFSLTDLSRRQRDILVGLVQGDSEKQLALRLGISRHTVHDHLKTLHRRMEVSNRGELLGKCLKYWPVLRRLESDGHG
jgi:DNA-binding CsgD family transcriptional regulator